MGAYGKEVDVHVVDGVPLTGVHDVGRASAEVAKPSSATSATVRTFRGAVKNKRPISVLVSALRRAT